MAQSLLSRLLPVRRKKTADQEIRLQSSNSEIWSHPLVAQCYKQMSLGRRDIETNIGDEASARKLTERVIDQWFHLAKDDPYWSNVTVDAYKSENLNDETVKQFYETGEDDLKTLRAFENRCNAHIPDGTCLELGAGVGRHTLALAKRFKRVIAVDVSERLLGIAESNAKRRGITNVETLVLRSPEDLKTVGPLDFFMAQSVLPCNAPPIQRMLLESAFRNLRAGGFAWFETPDWLEGYTFSTRDFLASPPSSNCDCHCFPKTDVLGMLRKESMTLLDFHSTFYTEGFGCYTYFARKD